MQVQTTVPLLIDHLFRASYGRLVASLTRTFGPSELDQVEDAVQEALLRAVKLWPLEGIPDQPEAWLLQVSRHLLLDATRRRATIRRKTDQIQRAVATAESVNTTPTPHEIQDDTLRLMFTCCLPTLPPVTRIALTLKTLCGFGVAEIASALLAQDATVAQRLSRAKSQLQRERPTFEVPPPAELGRRLDSVLEVLYLMFNEGYRACRGDTLVRHDLVHESLRLAELLLDVEATRLPQVHALLALMRFQGARLPARLDAGGEPLTLALQDRRAWDRAWIARGLQHLAASIDGADMTTYHVEAAIASLHAATPTYADTPWGEILARYDLLLQLHESPVVRLNRAIAVAKVYGVAAGLAELDQLAQLPAMTDYALLHASRGQLLWVLGQQAAATDALRHAVRGSTNRPERLFLEKRLAACARGEAAPLW